MVTAQNAKSEIESQLPCMDQSESCGAPRAIYSSRKNSLPFQERVLTLDRQVKIGRSIARIQPSSSNGIFDCKVLSRNHAIIWYENEKFYIKDTKSSNGTFVNSQRLSRNGEESMSREIWSGDVVQFGVDVQENESKVTHGCIIGTLRLIGPNGKEAQPSVVNTARNSPESYQQDEISKLNLIVFEALQREWRLKHRLTELESTLSDLEKSCRTTLASRFEETKLLSKIENHDHRAKILKKMRPGSVDAGDVNVVDQLLKDVENVQMTSHDIQTRLHQELIDSEQSLTVALSDANNLQLEVNYLRDLASKSENIVHDVSKKCKEYIQTIANLEAQIQSQNTNENRTKGSVRTKWDEFFTIPIVIHESRTEDQKDLTENQDVKYTIADLYEKVSGLLKEKMNEEDFDKYESEEIHDLLVDSALQLLEKQPSVLHEKKIDLKSDTFLHQTICVDNEKRDLSCEKLIISSGSDKSAQTDQILSSSKETNTDLLDKVDTPNASKNEVPESLEVSMPDGCPEPATSSESTTTSSIDSPAISSSDGETIPSPSIGEAKEASCRLEEFLSTCVGSNNLLIWDKMKRVRDVCDCMLDDDPHIAEKLRDVHQLLKLLSEDVNSILVSSETLKSEQSDLEERLNQALQPHEPDIHGSLSFPDRFWALVVGYVICYIASSILVSLGLSS